MSFDPKNRVVVPPSSTAFRRRAVDMTEPMIPETPTSLHSTRSSTLKQPVSSQPSDNNTTYGITEDMEHGSLRLEDNDVFEVAIETPSLSQQETMSDDSYYCPTLSSSASVTTINNNNLQSYMDSRPSTRLHSICKSHDLFQVMVEVPHHLSATNASAIDENGHTPLHVISMNQSLEQVLESDQLLRFVVDTLWRTYPNAAVTSDQNGQLPFQQVINAWVQESMAPAVLGKGVKSSNDKGFPAASTRPQTTVSLTDIEVGKLLMAPFRQKNSYNQSRSDHVFAVHISKRIKAALVVLSTMLSEEADPEVASQMIDHFARTTPMLIKTVFLLADCIEREWMLQTSLIRGVLTCKYSVGRWLTDMLRSSNKFIANGAMAYLHVVSEPKIFNKAQTMALRSNTSNRSKSYHGSRRSLVHAVDDDRDETHEQQEELFAAVSRLADFIPSLLSLSYRQVEEAATTSLVQSVLDNHISRPFASMVVLCDAVFLLLEILGFRTAVNRLVLGYTNHDIMKWVYVANTGIFYFMIRELGKAVSLCMITRRARIYFLSFWNLSDLMSTLLAMTSVVSMRGYMVGAGNDLFFGYLRILFAITTGFLWLRVLSFLKAINMQLATFVLAILQITRDVIWFSFILFCFVICFGQMFFTLLVPSSCSAEPNSRQCSQSEYYLRVYEILLGGFGSFKRNDFASIFSVFLAVLFSFMVVLVLLNVLIAVASDSYEKCLIRSRHLFGRARVMLIAELASFQNLLKRSHKDEPDRVYKQWWSHYSSWGWSRASIVFFGLSSTVVFIWLVAETSGIFSKASSGGVWMGLISIFSIVLLFVSIMYFLASGADGESSNLIELTIAEWGGGWVKRGIIRILGGSSAGGGLDEHIWATSDDAWQGRLMYLQHEMSRIAEDNQEEMKVYIRNLEKLIKDTDTQIRSELLSLKRQSS